MKILTLLLAATGIGAVLYRMSLQQGARPSTDGNESPREPRLSQADDSFVKEEDGQSVLAAPRSDDLLPSEPSGLTR